MDAGVCRSVANCGVYFPPSNPAGSLYFSTSQVHPGGGYYILNFREFKFVIMLAVFKNTFLCILDMVMNQVVFFKTKLATHSE